MDFLTHVTIIAGLLLTSTMVQAQADTLPEGEWMGPVRMHEQTQRIAKFRVRHCSSGCEITMFYNDRQFQFRSLVVETNTMTFRLDTGSDYQCELLRDSDDSFSGECTTETEEDMRTIEINMHPPKVEPEDEPVVEPEDEPVVEPEVEPEGEPEVEPEGEPDR